MSSADAGPIVDGMFRIDDDGVVLVGGRSATSGLSHFPLRPVCPYTGADDVETVDLPRTGELWYCTEVTAAPPGYTGRVPYGLGVVELAGGLRVIGRVLGESPADLPKGAAMEVVADTVPDSDGIDRTVWAFATVRP
ncbi:MAG: Zn-ribbon domain-containing OB-fold protein [Microthrixaceae bacterium]